MRPWTALGVCLVTGSLWPGCTCMHPDQVACENDINCPPGQTCFEGFCVTLHDSGIDLSELFGEAGPGDGAPTPDGPGPLSDRAGAADLGTVDRAGRDGGGAPEVGEADRAPADRVLVDRALPDRAAPIDAAPAWDAGFCDPCDPVTQCGCPPSQACGVDGVTTVCRPAGEIGFGESCTTSSECARGSGCFGPADALYGICRRYCADDSQCEGGGGLCNLWVTYTEHMLCTDDCDPVTGGGCPPGFACYVFRNPDTDRDHTICRERTGYRDDDESCSLVTDCLAGSACVRDVPFPGDDYCHSYCRDDDDCPYYDECVSNYTVSGVSYGFCI